MGGSFCFCQLYRHAGKWRTDCFGGNIPVFRNIPDQHNGIISFFQFDGFESICGSVFIYGYQFLVFVVQIEAQMS